MQTYRTKDEKGRQIRMRGRVGPGEGGRTWTLIIPGIVVLMKVKDYTDKQDGAKLFPI